MSKWSLFWEYKNVSAFAYVNGKELVPITVLAVVKTTPERKAWRGEGFIWLFKGAQCTLAGGQPSSGGLLGCLFTAQGIQA